MKKKLLISAGAVALVAALLAGTWLFALPAIVAMSDADYAAFVSAQTVWQNSMGEAIPQTEIYAVMVQHMLQQDDSRPRKLLFIVYDGALASAAGVRAMEYPDGPIGTFAAQGMWLAHAGGVHALGDQTTDTAPGFASMFTGVWGAQNGITSNSDTLLSEHHTIMYRLHEAGLRVRFSYSWRSHGAVNYHHEMERAPELFDFSRNDVGTVVSMLDAIESGYDAVFGSLEHTDTWGHITGYHHRNPFYMRAFSRAECDAARLISAVQARVEVYGEDWLIILASDHGGIGINHGGTSLMESITWFASNRGIF